MASFYEPNQGENGLDMLVNYKLQERRQLAAEQRYAQREADQQNQANQKANAFNLNKSFDPTKYDIDAIHAQNLNDILSKGKQAGIDFLSKNKKADQYEFQNAISPYVDQANKYLSGVNAVNKRITDLSSVYKGDKFRNQTAYQNAIYKKAHYDDKGNLLPPEQVDVDAAHSYVDAHPELFIQDPTATIQKSYLDAAKGQIETHTDQSIDKRDGSAHTSTVKYMSTPYTGAPVLGADGNYTLPILSEPFRDADHKPIEGRNILNAQAFADMKASEPTAQAIRALTNKAHPNYDPDTNEGAQLEAETAYNMIKQMQGWAFRTYKEVLRATRTNHCSKRHVCRTWQVKTH